MSGSQPGSGPASPGPVSPGPGGGGAGTEPPEGAAPARRRASPWRRLARAARPRATRAQLLAGLLCAALGFAVVAQVRQTQSQGLEELRESDLVRILSDATDRSDRLAAEVRQLERTREQLTAGGSSAEAAARTARERLETYALLAGTVPATGPGVVLRIEDPAGVVRASTLLDAVQELRGAGAEALQIGGARVSASTALVDSPQGVLVDGTLVRPPYVVTAVGDPDALGPALHIPGGIVEAVASRGAVATVTQEEEVLVDAVRAAPQLELAEPAPEPGAGSGAARESP